jgi:hypothetical protein
MASATIAAYADAPGLITAQKVRAGGLGYAPKSGVPVVTPLSYQTIVALARSVSSSPELWDRLADWTGRKIAAASLSARSRLT